MLLAFDCEWFTMPALHPCHPLFQSHGRHDRPLGTVISLQLIGQTPEDELDRLTPWLEELQQGWHQTERCLKWVLGTGGVDYRPA